METRYLVITDSANIINKVKTIANGYWCVNNTVILFYYEASKEETNDIGIVRDKIKANTNGSFAIIEILTTGCAGAVGNFTKKETWDWIKSFCSDDEKKISKEAIKKYNDKQNVFSLDGASNVVNNQVCSNDEIKL